MSEDSSERPGKGKAFFLKVLRLLKVLFATMSIFVVSQFFAAIIVGVLLAATGTSPAGIERVFAESSFWQFIGIVFVEFLTVLGVGLVLRIKKRSINELNWQSPKLKQIARIALYFLIYIVVLFVVTAFIQAFIKSIDVSQKQQIGFDSAAGSSLLLVFVGLCVLVPIGEEVLYRGFLYRLSKKIVGLIPAAIITTVVFGLAHLEFTRDSPLNWIAAIDTGLFSIALIYAYEKEKTIWAPIILHGIKNSIAFVFLFVVR